MGSGADRVLRGVRLVPRGVPLVLRGVPPVLLDATLQSVRLVLRNIYITDLILRDATLVLRGVNRVPPSAGVCRAIAVADSATVSTEI